MCRQYVIVLLFGIFKGYNTSLLSREHFCLKFQDDAQGSDSCDRQVTKLVPANQENMSMTSIPPHTPLLYSKAGVCMGMLMFLIFAPKHR